MTADQVDIDDALARLRPQVTDENAARLLVDLVLELDAWRRSASPKQRGRFRQLARIRQIDQANVAAGKARRERVEAIEGLGVSRSKAYELTKDDPVQQPRTTSGPVG